MHPTIDTTVREERPINPAWSEVIVDDLSRLAVFSYIDEIRGKLTYYIGTPNHLTEANNILRPDYNNLTPFILTGDFIPDQGSLKGQKLLRLYEVTTAERDFIMRMYNELLDSIGETQQQWAGFTRVLLSPF